MDGAQSCTMVLAYTAALEHEKQGRTVFAQVQGQIAVHSKVQVSQGYIVRPCLIA